MLTRWEFREEMARVYSAIERGCDETAELRREIRTLYRVLIGLIVAILGVGASWVWVSLRIAGVV